MPVPIRSHLEQHEVRTVAQEGWDRLKNGELLAVAEEVGFEVFLTTDKNIRYQQNLSGRKIAIVVLGQQQWPKLRAHIQLVGEEKMCITCEHELWGEHRALEREFFKPCKTCNRFPGASSEGTCYHCFAVGNTIEECPECAGKPWSEEFREAKNEIEGPDEMLVPI